ncbi:MAG: serine/threonine-protein phosphatase [Oscillospiraceae bacterium]|nr:serine/threonine-protein phosphatase [Oscillospiraceae bacterium]
MRIASITSKGGRDKNEDAVGRITVGGVCCMAEADGTGAYGSGAIASGVAVDTILRAFSSNAEVSKNAALSYMEAANNAIEELKKSNENMSDIAASVVVVVADKKSAVMAYCGDCRIYRISGRLIQEVSDDQTGAFAAFLDGKLRYSEIRNNPARKNVLHRLGDGTGFNAVVSDPIKLGGRDKFLLCTDGLWEYVTEDFMEESLKGVKTPRDWVSRLIEERRKKAPEGSDNYSAVTFFVK